LLSLPGGFSANGLPIGCQLVGRPWDEPLLLRIGAELEDRVQLRRTPPRYV